MKRIFILLVGLMIFCGTKVPSYATLVDRGNGLIYDTDLNITWLADADYARTSGYDNDGLLDRNSARRWVDTLIYVGYDDWRLPVTLQPDPACSYQSSLSWGPNCTGSEMGHLFYNELGGAAWSSIQASSDPDPALFINLQFDYYWSTDYAPQPDLYSWDFGFGDGLQRAGNVPEAYVLAVRNGDVPAAAYPSGISTPVPEPGTLLFLGCGLLGMAVWRKRQGWGES